jgi:hypothetical protein
VLAAPAPSHAPAPPVRSCSTPTGSGWMYKVMPVAAPMLAELKASLDPEFFAAAMANLKRGAGYVIDESTRIAVGGPPVMEWERGKIEYKDGFTVMRVRRKSEGPA